MVKYILFLSVATSCILNIELNLCAQSKSNELTLEDIWYSPKFFGKSVSGVRSMNDGKHYSSFKEDKSSRSIDILKYEYETGKVVDTILKSKWLTEKRKDSLMLEEYQFSKDESKILIASDLERIYRHSTKEHIYIWDRKLKSLSKLTDGDKQMYSTFSPDANKVAFVRNNNLFMKDLDKNKEIQITFDGEKNKIINGASDWVYEEEFKLVKSFEWSPDGKKIAFYRFDESMVREFTLPRYGKLYPEFEKFKYPKAGEKNAVVTILIYDLKTGKTIKTDIGNAEDQYIPRILWTHTPNHICIFRMNRHQNKLELLMADALTGKSKTFFIEENKAYIELHDNLRFLEDQKHFIWTSEQGGFNHLYLYDLEGKLVRQITKGDWEITDFYGINEASNKLYFTSTEESPLERYLYSINIDGTDKKKLSTDVGQNRAFFSNTFDYYINYQSNITTPEFITLHRSNGDLVRVLEDNARLKETLKEYQLSYKEFFTFKTSEDVELNGWMIKPPDFNPKKQYPVFMTLYGGPGSQMVKNSWGSQKNIWYEYLAKKGYIVVCVDNRGTGGRGEAFTKLTYLQLGKYETIDQIEAAKYLGSIKYVDKERIGIQGWSYGGYMSSLCLTKGAPYFKMAIAVAPVTNWRFYDSIYTERYMRTPQENPDGYDENSPINHAEKLVGKYLLIHGTADDNVHPNNSWDWINTLIRANKTFDSEWYPDKNHGIRGGNTSLHVFRRMTDFILENL